MLDMAEEFGYQVTAFHHAVEAYKIADELAEAGVCGAMWADWWGFKMEAYDGIQENIAMVDRPEGGCAIVHSDSAEGIQRLNQEAAKAMVRGQPSGMDITEEHAIRWITQQCRAVPGHRWSRPARSRPARWRTWCSGTATRSASTPRPTWCLSMAHWCYDRSDPALQPESDFSLGQLLEVSP